MVPEVEGTAQFPFPALATEGAVVQGCPPTRAQAPEVTHDPAVQVA